MDKYKLIKRIKELYSKGENIIQYLRDKDQRDFNTLEDILMSYDFQSGSYIKSFAKNQDFKLRYTKSIANIINNLGAYQSIMEVGVGEATTLVNVLNQLDKEPETVLGFDISWSRVNFAKAFLKDFQKGDTKLFTANLFEIPLMDQSVDIVYTSHSIEPNGGKEKEALEELYRIANKYIILLEPSYELANEESRKRMEHHGYIKNLYQTAKDLNYKIVEHRLFDYSANPLNPTGLLIIEKEPSGDKNKESLVCPISKTRFIEGNDSFLYSPESLLAYPIINQIPCLLKENSILATHLLMDYPNFKAKHNIQLPI